MVRAVPGRFYIRSELWSSMSRQNTLPGIKVATHSNLGVSFEKEMEAVHIWYRLQRWADVRNIPRSWSYISQKDYLNYQQTHPAKSLAKTDDGRFMMRVKSDVDFVGGGLFQNKYFSIAFDCKETSTSRFPLNNVEPHQLDKLRDRTRCGFIAGIMLKFSETNRTFFVHYNLLSRRIEEMKKLKIGRRAKPGTASLSLTDCQDFTIEIFHHKQNMLWDYLPLLVSTFGGKL